MRHPYYTHEQNTALCELIYYLFTCKVSGYPSLNAPHHIEIYEYMPLMYTMASCRYCDRLLELSEIKRRCNHIERYHCHCHYYASVLLFFYHRLFTFILHLFSLGRSHSRAEQHLLLT